jgi:hypothetical protein
VVRRVVVVEEPAARARGHRVHQQAQLVDQSRREQLPHHGDRTGDADAPDAGVGLARGDGVEQIALDQLGGAPAIGWSLRTAGVGG